TYCAGLRIGELIRLTLADVDLESGTLEIRGTKFFKSRRLPLAAAVMVAVRQYLASISQTRAGWGCEPGGGLAFEWCVGSRWPAI
ncbi:MAG TPA: tyrosine-type recombinase/integrase, partial [Burkholderiales bacterium]|nr:tyrosine-type recombinase/integrase [Burkholderiales bacterium]